MNKCERIIRITGSVYELLSLQRGRAGKKEEEVESVVCKQAALLLIYT